MSRTIELERLTAHTHSPSLLWAGIVAVEISLLVAHFETTSAKIEQVRYLVYPFVWINAGLWAVSRTHPTAGNRRHRLFGLLVAGSYFVLVTNLAGNIGLGTPGTPLGFRIGWYAPGWGPLVALDSSVVRLYLVPFEVVGYVSLAYLVYANTLSLTRGTLSGVLGLVTCVGCTVPVLAPTVGLLGGPASALTTTAYQWSYDLGTLLFLITVGLLYASHRRSVPDR
ncbi:MAG: hypothetical protein R3324_20710 [Halobacteriales archaeon]|nr:hypothetical protein [Halobacteriales archaeon]